MKAFDLKNAPEEREVLVSSLADRHSFKSLPSVSCPIVVWNMQEGFTVLINKYRYKQMNKAFHNCTFCRTIIVNGRFYIFSLLMMTACQQALGNGTRGVHETIIYKYYRPLQKGSVIDGSMIRGVRTHENEVPKGAIDDGEIAVGRPVLRTVKSGHVILFSDCFTPEQLRLSSRIDAIQGTPTMRKMAARDKTKPYIEKKVNALFCRHKIKKGQIMEPSDVILKMVPLMQLPVSQTVDIWTVYKRRALHDIEAGERLLLEDVVPIDQMDRLKKSYSKS